MTDDDINFRLHRAQRSTFREEIEHLQKIYPLYAGSLPHPGLRRAILCHTQINCQVILQLVNHSLDHSADVRLWKLVRHTRLDNARVYSPNNDSLRSQTTKMARYTMDYEYERIEPVYSKAVTDSTGWIGGNPPRIYYCYQPERSQGVLPQ